MNKKTIFIITLMACLMFLPIVSATYENQFIHQYNLENGNDVNGTLTLTNDGASFVTGKFLNGVYFNGATQDLSGTGTPLTSAQIQSNWTINFWLNQTSRVNDSQAFSFITGATGQTIRFHPQASACTGSPAFGGYDGASFTKCFTGRPSYLNQWVMYTLVYNVTTGNILVYENTVNTINISMGAFGSTGRCGTGVTLGQEGNCGALGSNAYVGMMDSLGFWTTTLNKAEIDNLYLSQSPFNVSGPAGNVSITLTDFYTGTSLTNFSATAINASGYQYNGTTTSGTLNDWTYTFLSTDASLWNITLASTENGGYLTRTLLNQNVSSAITSTLAQSIISFTASEFISNTTLTSINFSTQYLTNTTQYMRAQLYLVNTSKTGYFNKSQNVTVTALSTTTVNIENVTKTRLNLTIKSALTNVTLSNWAVQLNNSVYSYSETQSTTGSNLVIDSITGNWTALVDVSGYALTLANLTLLDGVNNVTLYIYSSESINFFFYNEQTGALILNPNVTIELIGSYASYNRTSSNNGTVYIDILTPDAYVARYYATGFNPRFSYVSVGSRTTQNVSLYLLPSANGTNITITVLQQDGSQVQSALIKVLKYDLASNSYIVREQILTDYAGQAIVDVLYNQEFYKFIVESPVGTIALETDPAYITSSTLTLILDSELAGTLYTYIQNAGGLVTFNTATNNFRFTWSGTNNIVSNACLKVYLLYDNYTANYLGQNCSTASAGTLLYAVSNSTQAQYYAEGWFTLVIGDRKVSEAFADLRTNNYFGLLGVLIAVGLTVTITFIFIKTSTPQVALMSLPLGITVTNLTGITQFASWVPFGLFAVCLVLVVSMGRDK